MRRRATIVALGLMLRLQIAQATLDMKYYELAQNYCAMSSNDVAYNAFLPRRAPLPPVRIDEATGDLLISYPATTQGRYSLEGVLHDSVSGNCSYCPYDESPQGLPAEYVPSSGLRNPPVAMWGPCFDGKPSTQNQMACVQNLALFPPDYCGEYFFPTQKRNPYISASILGGKSWNPNFQHYFVADSRSPTGISNVDAFQTQIDPTQYGLGKASVLGWLDGLRVYYSNGTSSTVLQNQYLTQNGAENWPRYAQHYCRMSCHRDSMLVMARPNPSDIAGHPKRFFLSRTGASNITILYQRCLRCPSYQAAYTAPYNGTFGYTMPGDPRDQGYTYNSDCYPWFGSVPVLAHTLISGNARYIFAGEQPQTHSEATDGILNPVLTIVQTGIPCPVDHYNDRCAHAFLLENNTNPQCKPCPAGYHTAGHTGAWFCLPPPGKTAQFVRGDKGVIESGLREALTLFVNASTNQSLAWARRDLLHYEWECGVRCYQCSNATGTAGLTPDQFNQKMIIEPLLVWQNCPEGYYCPTALEPPIACSAARPWSPAGSANADQCACLAGTYRLGAVCAPCPNATAMNCGTGQYLQGSAVCRGQNGATSGGQCAPCTNKPANAVYLAQVGQEFKVDGGVYVGVCAFACPYSTVYVGPRYGYGANTRCDAVTAIYNGNRQRIYSAALRTLNDTFRVEDTRSYLVDTLNALIMAYGSANSGSSSYALTSSRCPADHQYVVAPATIYSDYECANCPAAPSNGVRVDAVLSPKCAVRCADGYYFNETERTCSLCATLDQKCNARFGKASGYYIRGAGCYGSDDPFPTPDPLDGCVQCGRLVSECTSKNEYLSLNELASGCVCRSCAYTLHANEYLAAPCGPTSAPVIGTCRLTCPSGSWLRGECTANTTGVCQNCTTYKPGYRRDSDCGTVVDATWTPCGVDAASGVFTPGFYCDGAGAQTPCPNNLTSDMYAYGAERCFCPAGTTPHSADGQTTCNPIRCADATPSLLAPGAGWRSNSYMALNTERTDTVCLACGAGSYSLGDGVGPAACVCPAQSYRNVSGGACVTCAAATCSGSGAYLAVPHQACATGLDVRPPACECLRPPFMQTADACAPSACNAGFERAPATAVAPDHASPVSGSPVYVPPSMTPWQTLFSQPNRIIKDLAVTSDLNGWGAPTSLQYALWTLQGNVDYNVYAMLVSGGTAYNYDPYTTAASIWNVMRLSDLTQCTLQALAVAQWGTPQTLSGTRVSVDVGLVVWDAKAKSAGPSLHLHLNQLEVGSTGALPAWTQAGLTKVAIDLETPTDANAVAIAHAYAFPGAATTLSAKARSTFYVAAVLAGGNHSRVLAVSPAEGRVLASLAVTGAIRAMTVMARASSGAVHLYLSLQDDANNNRVQLFEWTALSTTTLASSARIDELFFPAANDAAAVFLAPVLWPWSASPLFFALAPMPSDPIRYRDYGRPRRRLLVADMVQRTLVPPQGLHPLTAPVALAVTARGAGLPLLIAASEGTLFKLETTMCTSSTAVPVYWDGAACREAACVRSRNCLRSAGQVWDPVALRCTCLPGYYPSGAAGGCAACPTGYYCTGDTQAAVLCPASQTSAPLSDAPSDCLCGQLGQYYDSSASPPRCIICPQGHWCPNQWTRLPCPGTSTGTSVGGLVWPRNCECAPGFAGVGCTPCPSGFVCARPASTASATTVNKMAVALSLPAGTGATACASVFYPLLTTRFRTSAIDYLKQPDTLANRLLCLHVPTPDGRTAIDDIVMIVVLIDAEDRNRFDTSFGALGAYLRDNAGSNATVKSLNPNSGALTLTAIANNTPTRCQAGYAPSIDATRCVCAPGYTSSGGTVCAPCPAGQYKAKLDADVCRDCPIGSTSSAGASACIAFGANNNNNLNGTGGNANTNNNNTDNIMLIAGSVGGGVLLVGLLVWGFMAFSAPS